MPPVLSPVRAWPVLRAGLCWLPLAAAAAPPASAATAAPAATPPAALADTCAAIATQIDAKVRAAGVGNYTLVVVNLEADSPGRIVGTCGNGRRKIVYNVVGPQSTGGSAVPAAIVPAVPGAPANVGPPGVVTSTIPGVSTGAAARVDSTARPAAAGVLTECREGWTGPDCRQRVSVPPRP